MDTSNIRHTRHDVQSVQQERKLAAVTKREREKD